MADSGFVTGVGSVETGDAVSKLHEIITQFDEGKKKIKVIEQTLDNGLDLSSQERTQLETKKDKIIFEIHRLESGKKRLLSRLY